MSSTTAPTSEDVKYLRSLPAIRERCQRVFALAQQGKLEYFDYVADNEPKAVAYCQKIIERDFGHNVASIPPHGRWRHFDAMGLPRITTLLAQFHAQTPSVTPLEAARRLVDLFMVSVLLDAGAGPRWVYEELKTGLRIGRSEGLAVASLDMFESGLFARNEEEGGDGVREKCEAQALARLTPELLSISLQVDPSSNPMDGLEGRAGLLARLGNVVSTDQHGYFSGPKDSTTAGSAKRPGFLVDYLQNHATTKTNPTTNQVEVQVPVLWEALIEGLAPVWPTEGRTVLDGVVMGDVWPCPALQETSSSQPAQSKSLVPFHKLSQWLCYSIMEPMEQTLGWKFVNGEHQTGLPEYRNGGLLIDTGVLVPKPKLYAASSNTASPIPTLTPSHPAVVEWRACTVIMLDRIAAALRKSMGLADEELNLKQVLEAATWKGGREIAREKRPESGGPPINIDSDGTIF